MHKLLARLGVKPLATVAVFGLVLLLSGNWALPLLDRDEPRFAEASREMCQRGDWVIPWFNGQYRFDKPPLIYWCQAACYRLMGESAWSARMPSAIFATATALLLVLWGRRMGKQQAGFYAALMWLTCLQVLVHGRLAVADMPMVFFVTLSIWAGWEISRPEAGWSWGWQGLFVGSLTLGFLAKGPVAWLPIGGLMLARAFRHGSFHFSWLWLLAVIAASLAMLGVWAVPALMATHGEYFRVGIGRHVIHRSFDVMEGHGTRGWLGYIATLPLYFLTFFASFFPWSLGIPQRLSRWWGARQEDAHGWYLLVQAALVFAVFSLVRTKLPHYTLPAFPCLALWLGCRLATVTNLDSVSVKHQLGNEEATEIQNPEFKKEDVRNSPPPRLAWGVAGMAGLTLAVTLGLFPVARQHLIAANLWHQVRPHVRPEMEVGAVGFGEPSIVWEFRQGLTNYVQFVRPEQASSYMARPGLRLLILPTAQTDKLLKDLPSDILRIRTNGWDTAGFKQHDLTALIRPVTAIYETVVGSKQN